MSTHAALSKRSVAKNGVAKSNSWSVVVSSKLADGSGLSPVYCVFSETKTGGVSYLPVSPSFANQYVGVYDDSGKKVYGNAVSHSQNNGGCTFILAFVNDGSEEAAISYQLTNVASLPTGVLARVYNEKTGASDSVTDGSVKVVVAAGGTEYRMLAVGGTAFLAKMGASLKTGSLKFLGVSPNPFGSVVHIRYSVPEAGVNNITFAIYDLRGRTVWEKVVDARGGQGIRELVWNGKTEGGRPVASGSYIVRMVALDGNSKSAGTFEKRMTYLPMSGR
jgi:hypothetical protein